MPRRLTLRQVEAFKAVMETGSISAAAHMMHISQPAMSKLISHFEADAELRLFDRVKGRLVPTECGLRLQENIDRIFAGLRQVESAVETLRREEQGQLSIGVMPALAGSFIQRATSNFLERHPNVFCTIRAMASERIIESLVTRKLDVGVISARIENPLFTLEPLMEQPLVCVMAPDHPFATRSHITPQDLDGAEFVTFPPDTYAGHLIETLLDEHGVKPQIVLLANVAPTLCEFVTAGRALSLLHPLTFSGLEQRLVVRRFEPEIPYSFKLCRSADSRNAQLVEAFTRELHTTAIQISRAVLETTKGGRATSRGKKRAIT